MEKTYIAIDLKSFYASVECVSRGLNPLTANLVVADESRTDKTICLAVSPALKSFGVPGRPRLFEVKERLREVNRQRAARAPGHRFTGKSHLAPELRADPGLEADFLITCPRMSAYMETSAKIFDIYSRYVSPEDIHVYSVDEVFLDATRYLRQYALTAKELTAKLLRAVLAETGITATAGIGENLYLAKIAMDVEAKHMPADADGARIASLTEREYREKYWCHKPLTDFWRVGKGTVARLASRGMYTMGDVARCSVQDERCLYELFGVNAELLIDHAWGRESCTIADIKAYRPESNSLSSGQVLKEPYPVERARLIVREMTDALAMDLVEKGLETDQVVLSIGYDAESLRRPESARAYDGPVTEDRYGRKVPKGVHGSANLAGYCSSGKEMLAAMLGLYDRLVQPGLYVRYVTVGANRVMSRAQAEKRRAPEQLSFFDADTEARREQERDLERERRQQEAIADIRRRFGKNAILRGTSFCEGATARERNEQVGGHKA